MNFKEKYRRDNELLHAPGVMPEGVGNMRPAPSKSSLKRIAAAAVAACLLLTAVAALPALNSRGRDLPLVQTVSTGDLATAAGYGEIYDALCEVNSRTYGEAGYGVIFDSAVMEESAEIAGTAPTMAAANGVMTDSAASDNFLADTSKKDYSSTNTQKENVDEADVIKTDGRYIYRMSGSSIVIIDPFTMTVVSTVRPVIDEGVEGFSTESSKVYNGLIDVAYPYYGSGHLGNFYVSGDRMAVLYSSYSGGMRLADGSGTSDGPSCGVLVYDISDPADPVLLGRCGQSGDLRDSRLIGDYIYIVSNHYVYNMGSEGRPETYMPLLEENEQTCVMKPGDVCILPEAKSPSYSVITSVDLRSGSRHADAQAAFGCTGTVYADTERIVLCFPTDESVTEDVVVDGKNLNRSYGSDGTLLVSFAIGEGSVNQLASGSVPGHLLNQFSIDRHNGVLRVVTTLTSWEQRIWTDGVDRYEFEDSSTNGLYTLDESMNIIGKLDGLAEDERVYSVRFMGDMGYFVTFRQVDPLFAVDLSDPAAPAVLSALKIPGFSQYMHPYAEGLMLGLGMDADENTGATNGLKLSMFDISDPADVTECHKLIFDDIWWSEALGNHKAVVVSAGKDIIAFPIDNGYIICGYSADGFHERHRLELDTWSSSTRGLYIDECFFICTETTLYRYDMNTFELEDKLEFAEIDDCGFILVD